MKRLATAVVCLAALALAGSANAQVVSIVTTPTGSFTNSAGIAMAKVISEKTKVHAIVQAQAQAGMYAVEAGDAEFGMGNTFDTSFYVQGSAYYKGNGPKPNLREVGAILPLRVAMFVRKNSKIRSISDLKGKRLSAGFGSQKVIGRIIAAELANADLSYNDVRKVLAPNVKRAADDFIAGKTDALFFAIGSAPVRQAAATVGGLRALPIDTSPKAVARLKKVLPGAYITVVKPRPGLDGITKPIKEVAIDLLLFTNKNVKPSVVYQVTKALHDNKGALAAAFKPFIYFKPGHMAVKVQSLPFDPGAARYYKQIGLLK